MALLTGLRDISAKQMATASEEPKTIPSNLLKQFLNEKSQAAEEDIPRQLCSDRWLVMLYFGRRAANHILPSPACITKKYERCMCSVAASAVRSDTLPYSSYAKGLCFGWG